MARPEPAPLPVPVGRLGGITRGRVTVEQIWDAVPDVRCKGLCTDSCGPIGMTEEEFIKVQDRIPDFPMAVEMVEEMQEVGITNYHCPALVDGKCTVYDVRPLICRLWGAEESMKCEHGCRPASGWLSHEEGSMLMQLCFDVGGEPV